MCCKYRKRHDGIFRNEGGRGAGAVTSATSVLQDLLPVTSTTIKTQHPWDGVGTGVRCPEQMRTARKAFGTGKEGFSFLFFRTTHIYYLWPWRLGVQSGSFWAQVKVSAGLHSSLGGSEGDSGFLLFPVSRSCLGSLTHVPLAYFLSIYLFIFIYFE